MDDAKKKPELIGIIKVGVTIDEMPHHPDCPDHPDNLGSGGGPSKVNSDAFRSGWDNIFGGKKTIGEA